MDKGTKLNDGWLDKSKQRIFRVQSKLLSPRSSLLLTHKSQHPTICHVMAWRDSFIILLNKYNYPFRKPIPPTTIIQRLEVWILIMAPPDSDGLRRTQTPSHNGSVLTFCLLSLKLYLSCAHGGAWLSIYPMFSWSHFIDFFHFF